LAAPHATFVFADIAGFTTLTEAHGDDAGCASVACLLFPLGNECAETARCHAD
jgi:class 3 adenylate cyclase